MRDFIDQGHGLSNRHLCAILRLRLETFHLEADHYQKLGN